MRCIAGVLGSSWRLHDQAVPMLVYHSVRTWFKTGCELVFPLLWHKHLISRKYLWVPRIPLHVSVRFALTLLFIAPITHFLFDMYIAQLRKLGAYFATRQGLHQSLSEVSFCTLQEKHSALSSSPSFQHVRFGAFSEASYFGAQLLHLHGAILLLPCGV